MTRIRKRLPSPAMIVAIVALVAATAGTSYAALFGVGKFRDGAKDKIVGVGKITWVTTQHTTAGANESVSAVCPSGRIPIGGGIKTTNAASNLLSSHPSPNGWAGRVNLVATDTATTTVVCARSRAVTGSPPSP